MELRVNTDKMMQVAKVLDRNGRDIVNSYRRECTSIIRELDRIAAKYREYSSVTSKVEKIQTHLKNAIEMTKELEQDNERVVRGLKEAVKLYRQEEQETLRIVRGNRLPSGGKITSRTIQIKSNIKSGKVNITTQEEAMKYMAEQNNSDKEGNFADFRMLEKAMEASNHDKQDPVEKILMSYGKEREISSEWLQERLKLLGASGISTQQNNSTPEGSYADFRQVEGEINNHIKEIDDFWENKDYFKDKWWRDHGKTMKALEMIKKEIEILGPITYDKLWNQDTDKIKAIQEGLNARVVGDADISTTNELENISAVYNLDQNSIYDIDLNKIDAIIDRERKNQKFEVKHPGLTRIMDEMEDINYGQPIYASVVFGTAAYGQIVRAQSKLKNQISAEQREIEIMQGNTDKTIPKEMAKANPLENGLYIKNGKPNGRPTLSGEKKLQFEKDVYNNNVDLDGTLRDPNTGGVIDWKPSQSRKNVVDFGHKSGYSYNDMFIKYKNGEITLEELKNFQFNPNNYRLETPSANRSHKYE